MDKIIPVSIALTSSILEGENYHCRLCESVFSRIQNLVDHIKIYHSFPHRCPHCEVSFSRKLNLNEHIRNFHYLTPNGVKKNDFVARCPYCDKSYGCEIFRFFSPPIPSKREKNILVLLSLYIFWGKYVYFSICEWYNSQFNCEYGFFLT